MERVDAAMFDRSPCRDERLRGHLAPEDAGSAILKTISAEDVHLDRLEIEEIEEIGDTLGHGGDGTVNGDAATVIDLG